MSSAQTPPRQERRLLWLLAALQFTHLMDFMVVMPLGPELMHRFHISTSQFGTVVAAYTLASAAMGVPGLFWLDRFDRKHTLLALYGAFIVATLACGAAPSHAALLAARTLAGACAGLMSAVLMSIIADVIPPERRGRAIGTVMMSLGLSAVVGVPVGLGLATRLGWNAPFWTLGGLATGVWLCLARVLPPIRRHLAPSASQSKPPSLAALASPELAWGWLLTFTVVFASFLLIPYLGTYMVGNVGLRQTDLPIVYLCGGVATLLAARGVGHLTDRWGPGWVLTALLLGTLAPHLTFTHLGPSPLPWVSAVFAVFMAVTSTRAIPTLALVSMRVPPALRGRFMAMNMAASDAASGLAAWASGALIATTPDGALIGFDGVGWLAATVTLCALGILWTLGRSTVALGATAS
ncbi:MFS transporter [Corallococcus sp. H22C18031201]|nr:MFS transporter [Corallococcus sp. H22C18031201]